MEKVGDEDYHLEKGTFTLCDGDVPSWKFSASSVDVNLVNMRRQEMPCST
jgi:LPS-assembly protein